MIRFDSVLVQMVEEDHGKPILTVPNQYALLDQAGYVLVAQAGHIFADQAGQVLARQPEQLLVSQAAAVLEAPDVPAASHEKTRVTLIEQLLLAQTGQLLGSSEVAHLPSAYQVQHLLHPMPPQTRSSLIQAKNLSLQGPGLHPP